MHAGAAVCPEPLKSAVGASPKRPFWCTLSPALTQYQISALVDGKPKAFNVPAALVEQVRKQIEMRDRFDAAATTICGINLKRFLKQKEGQ